MYYLHGQRNSHVVMYAWVQEIIHMNTLPPSLSRVHLIFHVSMLRKYNKDKSHILDFSTVHHNENLTNKEESKAILGKQVRKLKSKEIASVKEL